MKLNKCFCWMKIICCWILQHLANHTQKAREHHQDQKNFLRGSTVLVGRIVMPLLLTTHKCYLQICPCCCPIHHQQLQPTACNTTEFSINHCRGGSRIFLRRGCTTKEWRHWWWGKENLKARTYIWRRYKRYRNRTSNLR